MLSEARIWTARSAGLAAGTILVVLGAAAAGYAVGREDAPTSQEAGEERDAAYDVAFEESSQASRAASLDRGGRAGARAGEETGLVAGRRDGLADGTLKVEQQQAADAAAAAAAAEAAVAGLPTIPEGLEYVDQLPHGEPGYALPPEDRSLSCVGYDADTGQCIGD